MTRLTVSNSKLNTWRQCRRKYYYSYVQKLKRRAKAVPLTRGSIIHNMLEVHISGGDPWERYKKDKEEIESKLMKGERPLYADMFKDIEFIMKGYFKFYKDDELIYRSYKSTDIKGVTKKRYSEHYFEIEIAKGIDLNGYIDTVAKRIIDRLLWLIDHKTAKTIPDINLKITDLQGSIYAWVMPRIGMPKPDGVMWNYLRTEGITLPTLNKNGALSKRKDMSCTWDIYRKEVKKHGLKTSDYLDMKDTLKGKETEFYVRQYIPLNDNIIDSLIGDAITTAKEIRKIAGKDKTRNIGLHCQWCDYKELCKIHLIGMDDSYELKTRVHMRFKLIHRKDLFTYVFIVCLFFFSFSVLPCHYLSLHRLF